MATNKQAAAYAAEIAKLRAACARKDAALRWASERMEHPKTCGVLGKPLCPVCAALAEAAPTDTFDYRAAYEEIVTRCRQTPGKCFCGVHITPVCEAAPAAGPCSACGDGDTSQRFHKHAPPAAPEPAATVGRCAACGWPIEKHRTDGECPDEYGHVRAFKPAPEPQREEPER